MNGKVLIYGGSGGIGAATARALHRRGCDVHLAGRNEATLRALAAELDVSYTLGDVADAAFFEQTSQETGDVLVGLIYAVGTLTLKPIGRLSDEEVLYDFQTHSLGALRATRASLAALRKSEGMASVLFYSSVAATTGFSAHASMGLAKGAINGLTVSLAAELSPKIRVNAIAPSLTETPLAQGLTGNEQMSKSISGMHPLKRIGQPEDIARLSAFLISQDAGWITGQVMGVDGGRSSLVV